MTAAYLLVDSLGEIRKRKLDEELEGGGKQMKKEQDKRLSNYEQIKAQREGLTPPPRLTAPQRAQEERRQAKAAEAQTTPRI
jgi:hypothetical protein